MIWFVEITVNAVLNRVSTTYVNDTHQWKGEIIDIIPISYSMREETGGYVEPLFGSITLKSSMFDGDYPPPDSCAIKIMLSDTTEAAAVTVFEGSAHCRSFSRNGVEFDLYGEEYSATMNNDLWNDHLDDIFTTYCGGAYLNLTFSNQSSRAITLDVDRTAVASDEDVIDTLSNCAAAFNHFFYIKDSTLYLHDLLVDNSTSTLTEFNFKPAHYPKPIPYKLIQSSTYSVAGTLGYGEVYQSNVAEFTVGQAGATIEGHLTNSKTILELDTPELELPIYASVLPELGEKVSWTDVTTPPTGATLAAWMRVTGIFFNDANTLRLSGVGTYS